jgi:hypothetical protein
MERALKTVQARLPSVVQDVNEVRDSLIQKFRNDVIGNITDFRKLSKIATSIENLGVREREAKSAIKSIFDDGNKVGIDQVYNEHFALKYDARKILINIEALADYLASCAEDEPESLPEDIKEQLKRLQPLIKRALEQ